MVKLGGTKCRVGVNKVENNEGKMIILMGQTLKNREWNRIGV